MAIIRLLDARRGLYRKCEELFGNEKIAESIYRFLCDGIEECEDVAHERKKGEWLFKERREPQYDLVGVKTWATAYTCSECGFIHTVIEDFGHYAFCPRCGAYMGEETEDD